MSGWAFPLVTCVHLHVNCTHQPAGARVSPFLNLKTYVEFSSLIYVVLHISLHLKVSIHLLDENVSFKSFYIHCHQNVT